MEEAELLKERLHAITDKRRVQEDIGQKKLEIDKEKLKLQHLKKKALREQWLMDGSATQNSQQRQNLLADQQQTRQLQFNIHRIEKEIEALERKESNISTNEGFILKRLRAVERSSEDIIKEAKENFKPEPIQLSPLPPDVPMSYKPLNSRLLPDGNTDGDEPKQTLFAMEINVQKDLRTGESRVISTATVTPQELQQRGVKVYDDGRKCVYAMRWDGEGPAPGAGLGSHGVDELSPSEVEQLLREATENKQQMAPARGIASRGHQRELSNGSRGPGLFAYAPPPLTRRGSRAQSYGQPSHGINRHMQSYDYDQEVDSRPELGYLSANHIPPRSYISRSESRIDKYYQPTNGFLHRQSHAPSYSELYRLTGHTTQPSAFFYDSAHQERCPSPLYQDDPPFRILNALPANQDASESVTAIFMGYQTAEDDSAQGLGYDGSIKAELVVIGDDDDSGGRDGAGEGYRNYGYQQGRYGAEPEVNCNVNNSREKGHTDGQQKDGRTDGRQGAGIRKIKKRQKHCCLVM